MVLTVDIADIERNLQEQGLTAGQYGSYGSIGRAGDSPYGQPYPPEGQDQGQAQQKSNTQPPLYRVSIGYKNNGDSFMYLDYENRCCLIAFTAMFVLCNTIYFTLTLLLPLREYFEILADVNDSGTMSFASGFTFCILVACALCFICDWVFYCGFTPSLPANPCPLTIYSLLYAACMVLNFVYIILIILAINQPDGKRSVDGNIFTVELVTAGIFLLSQCGFQFVSYRARKSLKAVHKQIPDQTTLDLLLSMGPSSSLNLQVPVGHAHYSGGPPGSASAPSYYNYSNAYPPMQQTDD